VELFALMISDY